MKALGLSVITAIAISVLGASGSFAAPAAGAAIDSAASVNSLAQHVYWRRGYWRWHRPWHWYHHSWCHYHPYRCGWR
jgi:hypothetical protein